MRQSRTAFPTDAFASSAPVIKRLGQNFLVSEHYCQLIVNSLGLTKDIQVVEVGPGRGAITRLLFAKAGGVTTVEIDKQLAKDLETAFKDTALVAVHGDGMRIDLAALCDKRFASHYFVANLPYYVATPLVVKALATGAFEKIAFMIQKELADRFVAAPGSKGYGAVSALLQATCQARILFDVPRSAFSPVPSVDSCFVLLEPLAESPASIADFSRFLRSCFSSRRKNIKNNLLAFVNGEKARKALKSASISETLRPEDINPGAFLTLFNVLKNNADD